MHNVAEADISCILIVGSGKLATELIGNLPMHGFPRVHPWEDRFQNLPGKTIVVHAGSGRELGEVCRYCSMNGSVLVELSTSGKLAESMVHFPTIVCSNTNILILKFMAMLRNHGPQFSKFKIEIIESHQSTKKSKPGTAIDLANYLRLDPNSITSLRDTELQQELLKLTPDQLARHAYHRIHISDGNAEISFETKVLGEAPYSSGLSQILKGIQGRSLEARIYDVVDLVAEGLI